jgi:hypothetical protein
MLISCNRWLTIPNKMIQKCSFCSYEICRNLAKIKKYMSQTKNLIFYWVPFASQNSRKVMKVQIKKESKTSVCVYLRVKSKRRERRALLSLKNEIKSHRLRSIEMIMFDAPKIHESKSLLYLQPERNVVFVTLQHNSSPEHFLRLVYNYFQRNMCLSAA